MTVTYLSSRDFEIMLSRQTALYQRETPGEGDWVIFADGVERRISYTWPDGVQTSGYNGGDGGSYYLGEGYVSYSGPLFGTVPTATLRRDSLGYRAGRVWFFHNDVHMAHNGVDTLAWFKVWRCSEVAPR